mmetsp:Transcript_11498/g.25748  ORF Transcript_11498/g.25748 Transcript_11498/m.25748 type:complete len:277 (-) Transcript_11498:941-1771(-)
MHPFGQIAQILSVHAELARAAAVELRRVLLPHQHHVMRAERLVRARPAQVAHPAVRLASIDPRQRGEAVPHLGRRLVPRRRVDPEEALDGEEQVARLEGDVAHADVVHEVLGEPRLVDHLRKLVLARDLPHVERGGAHLERQLRLLLGAGRVCSRLTRGLLRREIRIVHELRDLVPRLLDVVHLLVAALEPVRQEVHLDVVREQLPAEGCVVHVVHARRVDAIHPLLLGVWAEPLAECADGERHAEEERRAHVAQLVDLVVDNLRRARELPVAREQ